MEGGKRFFAQFAKTALVLVKDDLIHEDRLKLNHYVYSTNKTKKENLEICQHCSVLFSKITCDTKFVCGNKKCVPSSKQFCGRTGRLSHCIPGRECVCWSCESQNCPVCIKNCTVCKKVFCDDCFVSCVFCEEVAVGVCTNCYRSKDPSHLFMNNDEDGVVVCETCIGKLNTRVVERTQKRLKVDNESEK